MSEKSSDLYGSAETIVALATPQGESGLAVVRLSGPEAVAITQAVFRNAEFTSSPQSHRAYYGSVVWPVEAETVCGDTTPRRKYYSEVGPASKAGEVVDEAIVLPMLAPRSYTGQDSVEFFCHGGRMPARLVIEACLRAGAAAASPGEFTRRAFLNGKLSLDQAEAVADLIHAEDVLAAGAALRQMRGGFDRELESLEIPLQELLADLEGCLEFTEDEEVTITHFRQVATVEKALADLERLLSLAPAGRLLREGVQVVLVGPPNVGKSSLFNALLGEERVLVHHEPGTTRDVVTARLHRKGVLFVLHDTAGLRTTGECVERMGMEKTRNSLDQADCVLYLQEAAKEKDGQINKSINIDMFDRNETRQNIKALNILTKIDLFTNKETAGGQSSSLDIIETSAKTGCGVEKLWERLEEVAVQETMATAATMGVVMNSRHQHKLIQCATRLSSLREELVNRVAGPEVVATLLAGILANLGEVSGRVFTEDILDKVVSRFCVGK